MSLLTAIDNNISNDLNNFTTIISKRSIKNLHNRDKSYRIKHGKIVEKHIIFFLKNLGLDVYESSEYDDIHNKIDMYLKLKDIPNRLTCQIKVRFKNDDPIVETMRNIKINQLLKKDATTLLNGRDVTKPIDIYIVATRLKLFIIETKNLKDISIKNSIKLINEFKKFKNGKKNIDEITICRSKRGVMKLYNNDGITILLNDGKNYKINFFANVSNIECITINEQIFNYV